MLVLRRRKAAGALPIAPDGEALQAPLKLPQVEFPREERCLAAGVDRIMRSNGRPYAVRAEDLGSRDAASVEREALHAVLLEDARPEALGVPQEHIVEIGALHEIAIRIDIEILEIELP